MRIAIDHRTQYRFSEPQQRLIELLRLTPDDTQDQAVVAWRIDVDCDARLREGVDGFGNRTTMVYAAGPIESIEINVSGEVLTNPTSGMVRGAVETLPPELYLRATTRTFAREALRRFAGTIGGEERLDLLLRLTDALHTRFRVTEQDRDSGLTAEAAFTREALTPRDLAHVFIGAARTLAVPTRYVSGYRANGGDGAHATPHAWAEAWVERLGWVAFDPSAGMSADEAYVRVAVGLDAGGAAPIVGARIGAGEEALDVDVRVDRLNGEA